MANSVDKESTAEDDVHYTVFLRLPFPRAGFVDPPSVDWDAAKEAELWRTLSFASTKGQDLDWNELSERFGVTLDFLSRQAAWLYETHLSQVRAQLRKVSKSASGGNPSVPASVTGSGNVGVSTQTTPHVGGDAGDGLMSAGAVKGGLVSRRSSNNTVTGAITSSPSSDTRTSSFRQAGTRQRRQSSNASKASIELSPKYAKPPMERIHSSSAVDSSSSSSELESSKVSSRRKDLPRRPRPSFAKPDLVPYSDADEDAGEGQAPFLPFSDTVTEQSTEQSQAPTDHHVTPRASRKGFRSSKDATVDSTNSASSSSLPPASALAGSRTKHSTQSSSQAPSAKEPGSDGTPSMGSSFSDLDDVSQSALEEALAAEMQHGGMASRISTISQALRSRYL